MNGQEGGMQIQMKAIVGAGLAAAVLAVAFPAWAYTKGDWVLAKYRNGAYYFPGIVASQVGDQVTITYDDGDKETLPSNLVKPYNWRIGSRVECNWKGGGEWYAGRITALGGNTLSIAYDDGDKEKTTTGKCRSR